MKLDEISISGYKSIQELKNFKLRNLNVLIGANGAGKSNFISVFKLLTQLANGNLQYFVSQQGGPDTFLRGTRKRTPVMSLSFSFGSIIYHVELEATIGNQLLFKKEEIILGDKNNEPHLQNYGHIETKLSTREKPFEVDTHDSIKNWCVFHFNDSSNNAFVKQPHDRSDTSQLKHDAGNLAAYLFMLKENYFDAYWRIIETIHLVAPFFGDFFMRKPLPNKVELEWTEKNDIDTVYSVHALSDGTLRFICLTTLLLQPIELLPDAILIDEPELGLHPYAINLLAAMIRRVSEEKQIIVSTQSIELLNQFEPEDVVVVERENNSSIFKHLNLDKLKDWLEDYNLGELWKSNVLGGRPTR